jgi:acetyl-CoA carboxylase biotin carboxyl carrier protein
MDHRELKKLVQLMNDNGLVELEIEEQGLRVVLRKPGSGAPVVHMAPAAAAVVPAPAAAPAADAAPAAPPARPPGTKDIVSPMVGTFYRRPSPESQPYAEVGSMVKAETVVCIVEAMKVNNEIKAGLDGEVVEILAEDGQAVEFDQALFRVKVD